MKILCLFIDREVEVYREVGDWSSQDILLDVKVLFFFIMQFIRFFRLFLIVQGIMFDFWYEVLMVGIQVLLDWLIGELFGVGKGREDFIEFFFFKYVTGQLEVQFELRGFVVEGSRYMGVSCVGRLLGELFRYGRSGKVQFRFFGDFSSVFFFFDILVFVILRIVLRLQVGVGGILGFFFWLLSLILGFIILVGLVQVLESLVGVLCIWGLGWMLYWCLVLKVFGCILGIIKNKLIQEKRFWSSCIEIEEM